MGEDYHSVSEPSTAPGAAPTGGRPAVTGAESQRSPHRSERLSAMARLIFLEAGLHSLTVPDCASSAEESGPFLQFSVPPSDQLDPAEILTGWEERGAWIGPEGGTIVVRSAMGGGQVLATIYQAARSHLLDEIDILRLDRPRGASARKTDRPDVEVVDEQKPAAPLAIADPEPIETFESSAEAIELTITVHIEGRGDQEFRSAVWNGGVGQKLQIEAFRVRPSGPLAEDDIEYKAFGAGNVETRWSSGGRVCGAPGRNLPLTGFAIRLRGTAAERFEVSYQGSFFEAGVGPLVTDGQPCLSSQPEDRLEAISVRIAPRSHQLDVSVD